MTSFKKEAPQRRMPWCCRSNSKAGEDRAEHKNQGVGKGLVEEKTRLGCVERSWRKGSSAPGQEPAWGWFYPMILLTSTAAVKAHQ